MLRICHYHKTIYFSFAATKRKVTKEKSPLFKNNLFSSSSEKPAIQVSPHKPTHRDCLAQCLRFFLR